MIGDLTYTYDAAGNRIKTGGSFARSTMPPALASSTYNANNQQTTFGSVTETYDLNGNLATVTEAGITTTYTWNARNQLTAISNPGFSASFTYDSFGRRTGKTVGGVATNFVYDGLNPVQEKSGSTVTANLLTGLGIDEFFTRTDGVGARALLTDALGSTIALGDGTGSLVTQYTYEPFGVTSETGAASGNAFKYTGREDDGSGLYYYRARYYHPRLQRFISEDPIGFGGGDFNLYAYVGQNPLGWSDSLGLAKCIYSISQHTLICTSDDGLTQQVGPGGVHSGLGQCTNNVQCTGQKRVGPISPGSYELVPTTKYGGSYWLKEGWLTRQLCKAGFGRCEFFLHLGVRSEGCITVVRTDSTATGQFNKLKDLLQNDPTNSLEVKP
ncbi:MAG: DUF2778 domain-containing protein [Nitrospira sp.]|nr:DUF2778 domain-containing protein [Nitrospira sp.]